MSLKITLQKSHLSNCTKAFVVRSILSGNVSWDSFVEIMSKGRTALSKIEIIGAMQLFIEELIKLLADGKAVKTPAGLFYPCAGGSMDSPKDDFLPADTSTNHELRIHFRPDSALEKFVVENANLIRSDIADLSAPKVRSAFSSETSEIGATKLGDILNVYGYNLKFDRANTLEGLFFIDQTGAETRATIYSQILPKTIAAAVPSSLTPGIYTLAVRSFANGKTLHEGFLKGLTVNGA